MSREDPALSLFNMSKEVMAIGDREEIFRLWLEEEQKRIGRELEEGIDYEVECCHDRIVVYYYNRSGSECEALVITDTPLLH